MRIEQILRRQEGVISLHQSVAAGLGARGVSNRVGSGRWERVHPRVFRATDHALTDRARCWADGGTPALLRLEPHKVRPVGDNPFITEGYEYRGGRGLPVGAKG